MSDSLTGPHTRPGEISRIAQSEVDFRVETLSGIARIEALFASHEKQDERQFAALEARMGTVSSNVGDIDKDRQKIFGMKDFAMGLFAIIGALGSIIFGILQLIKTVKP